MQLFQKGPDIPDHLLQAHEDGRVVFFCGAGISYPAGLPGFKSLVECVRESLGIDFSAPQASAFERGSYDGVFGLIEGNPVIGREVVRRQVARVLTPNLDLTDATTTHEALLTLSLARDGRRRLITTNFDRLFEEVKAAKNIRFESYKAPLLPVPKNRWDGIVYLHGLLSERPTESDLNQLVLSSGDFGLAYLTERWAARFVSELFRARTICFVGYSINDPVLRYMMDALAADRLLGESSPEVFAFASYASSEGGADLAKAEWCAKNVTPILYRDCRNHYYLHRTLREWANVYRDGVFGSESLVTRYAASKPVGSTQEDDFVGRLLWALSHRSGLPAKRFAEFEPLPPLEWLEEMMKPRYGHVDLERFGVRPNETTDEKLRFSLLARPWPYTLSTDMRLADHRALRAGKLDEVMRRLASWLARHVDNPNLLLWVAERGPQLHDEFSRSIERALESGDVRPTMRRLWRLALTGRLDDVTRYREAYSWRKRLSQNGYSPTLRLELIDLLTPRVRLSRPFINSLLGHDQHSHDAEVRTRELLDWEVVLTTKHAQEALKALVDDAQGQLALKNMMPDLTGLLRDVLDLMHELDGANERSDLSYIALPSVTPHEQNRDFHSWTLLVHLARDAWAANAGVSPELAKAEVNVWLSLPYPIFKRLAFFAATHRLVFSAEQASNILLQDSRWLWSLETQREAMRLLAALPEGLSKQSSERLQNVILEGPDRQTFRSDLAAEQIERLVDHEVWLRLSKFRDSGGKLTDAAAVRLGDIAQRYPDWRAEGDRDEFPFWMGDGDQWGTFTPTPIPRRDLVEWLKTHSSEDSSFRDDWELRCRSDFPRAIATLVGLSQQGHWYPDRWRSALQSWSDSAFLRSSWRFLAAPLANSPSEFLRGTAHASSTWLEAESKTFGGLEQCFFSLIRRLVDLHRDDALASTNDILTQAINHPVGHAIQALLNWWHRQKLRDGQGLQQEIASVFAISCNPRYKIYRYGRVLLGSHLIALFRVDRAWTQCHLLPLLDWAQSADEAAAVWNGFLWAPRLYRPLLSEIKPSFLEAVHHYQALGRLAERYAGFLTYAALEVADVFSTGELREAVAALPDAGRRQSARTLVDALEGAGDQRSDYWKNRVHPFINQFWPKNPEARTSTISVLFAELCIASGDAFEAAFYALRMWFVRTDEIGIVPHKLAISGLCTQYAETALGLLDAVIADNMRWPPNELGNCLEEIKATIPILEDDPRYLRLHQLLRRLSK